MSLQVTDDAIQLSFRRVQGGAPVTGLSVTVAVVKQSDGSVLLADTAMSESATTPGLYMYAWSSFPAVKTACMAIYSAQGKQFDEFFIVDDLVSRIDDADGRAI